MAADSRGGCGGGDNRRAFLKSAAAAGGAAALASSAPAWAQQAEPKQSGLPMVTLGKTGQKVPVLGMGTSWDARAQLRPGCHSSPAFATSTPRKPTKAGTAEQTLGEVLERTKMRKDVYLVTKNSRSKVGGPGAFEAYEKRLNASLERLRTDYVDCYYLHGVERPRDPAASAIPTSRRRSRSSRNRARSSSAA